VTAGLGLGHLEESKTKFSKVKLSCHHTYLAKSFPSKKSLRQLIRKEKKERHFCLQVKLSNSRFHVAMYVFDKI
jgi:hypothetical protein